MGSLLSITRAWINRFCRLWAGPQPPNSRKETTPHLRVIDESNNSMSLPALIGRLLSDRPVDGDVDAEAIEQIIRASDVSTLARLDTEIRRLSDWQYPPIKPTDVIRLSGGMLGPLGLLSFHSNGFIREVALKALAERTDGLELSFLLIRLNDWVVPIRNAAERAILDRLRPEYAEHFIRCLPLVFSLKDKGRINHGTVVEAIIALLQGADARTSLRHALNDRHRAVSRLAFWLLVQHPQSDLISILTDALTTKDTVIRLSAARVLRKQSADESLRTLLEGLSKDRFMPVRREALCEFAERLPDTATYLHAALLDSHSSMRETARFYLSKVGWTEFSTYYATHLADASRLDLSAAIEGLGETGNTAHAKTLSCFLTHIDSRVRRAAVRAIGRLDPEKFTQQLLAALLDAQPAVGKAARDVLASRAYLLKADEIWNVYQKAISSSSARGLALSLMADLQWWDSSILLINAVADPDEKIRAEALEHLRHWRADCGRLTMQPSVEQARGLKKAIARNRSLLDEVTRHDLEVHLKLATPRAQS